MQNFTQFLLKSTLTLFMAFSLFGIHAQTISVVKDGTTFGPFNIVPAAFGARFERCTSASAEAAIGVSVSGTTLACDSVVTNLTGKIAIIDRGVCEFSIKCLNAQKAGAAYIIVVNSNADAPFAMAIGSVGAQVTVPCFMVSQADGAVLKANVEGGNFTISLEPTATFSPDDVVLWGANGEGGFDGGLNGWTVVDYTRCRAAADATTRFTLWQWTERGTARRGAFVGGGGFLNSPTACNGAVAFDSDFYDNGGVSGNFGNGPCAAPQAGAIISPSIAISSFGEVGSVKVRFNQALRQFDSEYFVGWSIDGGITWDSIQINQDFPVNSNHINEDNVVVLPPSILTADSLRIKFTLNADYYYWIIDDVQIVQGPDKIVDLSIGNTNIISPRYGTVPVSQLNEDSTPFVFTPGAVITNNGFSETTNPKLNALITYRTFGTNSGNAVIVYNDSTTVSNLAADSTSAIIVTSDYTPQQSRTGYYDIIYSVSSDIDDVNDRNNTARSQFAVIDNYFSKARWDFANRRPARTNSYTRSGGGELEMIAGFTIPKGIGYQIDSAIFYVSVRAADGPLAGETVEAYLYEWNDADKNGSSSNNELTVLGLAFQEFAPSVTATEAWLRLPFIDFETFEEKPIKLKGDNKTYFLGIRYRGTRVLFIGFDEGLNTETLNALQASEGKLTDAELGYFFVTQWIDDIIPNVNSGSIFTGLSSPLATAFTISEVVSNVEEVLAQDAFTLTMYPNPVSEELTTSFNLEEGTNYLIYQIFDAQGKMIFTQRNNGFFQKDNAIFNVSRLPVGQYYLKLSTDKGFATKNFSVQR